MNFIWETLFFLPIGMILLRMAGKKTIAEMTSLEIITTLAIGTLIGHAINESGFWKTITIMVIIVLVLICSQYFILKYRWLEIVFVGKATIVISEGTILQENLRKLRMTQQQLEMRLRQKGISSIETIKTATLEANGQLGYELIFPAKPVTHAELNDILSQLNRQGTALKETPEQNNLFNKINR